MEKIKMQPTRPEDALLTDAFADFLEKCRAKNLSEKTLNIYTVHFKFFREYLSDPDKKVSDITEDTLEGFILYLQNRGCNDILYAGSALFLLLSDGRRVSPALQNQTPQSG